MSIQINEGSDEALEVVIATIQNCEKIQPKFAEGTSQHTLLKNRIKALYISKALLTRDESLRTYSHEDLVEALRPLESILHKCKTGQHKHQKTSAHYKRLQRMIEAMNLCKLLILNEISDS